VFAHIKSLIQDIWCQVCNQLETPGAAKSFLRGENFLNYVQHVFPGVEKFSRGVTPCDVFTGPFDALMITNNLHAFVQRCASSFNFYTFTSTVQYLYKSPFFSHHARFCMTVTKCSTYWCFVSVFAHLQHQYDGV